MCVSCLVGYIDKGIFVMVPHKACRGPLGGDAQPSRLRLSLALKGSHRVFVG